VRPATTSRPFDAAPVGGMTSTATSRADSSGSVNQNVEPQSSSLWTPMRPPMRSTSMRQIARPSPELPVPAATPAAAWL